MTADEFRASLKELGMSQAELCQKLGVNRSTVNRWAQGLLIVPQYAVAYLEALHDINRAARSFATYLESFAAHLESVAAHLEITHDANYP